jgi:hypothetical protein
MAERARRERELLVVFTLGTFHAAVLIAALVLVLYANGALASLLAGLSTVAGLSLFGALWAITVWSTSRTLRGAFTVPPWTSVPADTLIARAAWRGGVNGILFLGCTGVVLAISSALNGDLSGGTIGAGFLVFATVGAAAAFVIGFLVGLMFAGVDLALLRATNAILDENKSRP